MLPFGELMEMAHVESLVPFPVQPRYPLHFRVRRAPLRYAPDTPILKPGKSLFVIATPKAKKMPNAATQYHRRILATVFTLLILIVNLLKTLHPYCLRQCSIHPHPTLHPVDG
jgi:hypothetical protein